MDDEQLDLGLDVERTEWGKWVDSRRREAQTRRFLDRVGLADIDNYPWPKDSPDVERVSDIVAELFPDMSSVMNPGNADIVDQFVCFIGEYFARHTGSQWYNYDYFGPEYSLYDTINPALRFEFTDEGSTAFGLVSLAVDHGFQVIAGIAYERALEYGATLRDTQE